MSKSREVFGIHVSQDTYNKIKPLSQVVSRNSKVDLEVAISYVSMESPHFVVSDSVLEELTEVFEKITTSSRKQIADSICAYYKEAQPEQYAVVKQGFDQLLARPPKILEEPPTTMTTSQRNAETATPKRSRKTSTKEDTIIQNPLLRGLSRTKYSSSVDAKIYYKQQLEEQPDCFSRPVQPAIEFSPLFSSVRELEKKTNT